MKFFKLNTLIPLLMWVVPLISFLPVVISGYCEMRDGFTWETDYTTPAWVNSYLDWYLPGPLVLFVALFCLSFIVKAIVVQLELNRGKKVQPHSKAYRELRSTHPSPHQIVQSRTADDAVHILVKR